MSLLGITLVWGSAQAVFNDPVAQLQALRQYVAGQSLTFNTIVAPSPEDLSRDTHEWIVIWPPGMGLLLLPLVSHGVRLTTAVRMLASACYVLGALGWSAWIAQFRIPRALLLVLSAALPLSHYATTPLFQYYTESFNWAFAPWVLLLALALARRWQQRPEGRQFVYAVSLGMTLGLLYWFKYSTVFVAAGVLMFFAMSTAKQRDRNLAPLLALAFPFVVVVGGLMAWNKVMGTAANYAAETFGWFPRWQNILDCIGFFPLAMADAEGLLHWIFLRPEHPLLQKASMLPLVSFPAGVALFWLLFRRRDVEPPVRRARSVAATSAFGLFSVWTLSAGGAGHEARHVAVAAIAVVPVAVQEVAFLLRRWQRFAFVVAGCLLLGVPLLYGAASLADKAFRVRSNHATAAGFYDSR